VVKKRKGSDYELEFKPLLTINFTQGIFSLFFLRSIIYDLSFKTGHKIMKH